MRIIGKAIRPPALRVKHRFRNKVRVDDRMVGSERNCYLLAYTSGCTQETARGVRYRVEALPGGGYVTVYVNPDEETLNAIHEYREEIAKNHPGWITKVDFGVPKKELSLRVFPLKQLPWHVLANQNRYGS